MVSSLLNWAHGNLIVIGSKLIDFFLHILDPVPEFYLGQQYKYVRDESYCYR